MSKVRIRRKKAARQVPPPEPTLMNTITEKWPVIRELSLSFGGWIQNIISEVYFTMLNLFVFVVNKVFQLKSGVLLGAISAASIEYFLIVSNFTETYHGLGHASSYIAFGILFITEIILFHPFPYQKGAAPKKYTGKVAQKVIEYEGKLAKFEKKEATKKLGHYTKWFFIKGAVSIVFISLVIVNYNFSFGELSATIGKDVSTEKTIKYEEQLIKEQISQLSSQIKQAQKTISGYNPEKYMTKRKELAETVSELNKRKEDKIKELKNLSESQRSDTLAEKPIRFTYQQVKELTGLSLEKYVALVNAVLAFAIETMYLFLTYVYTVLSRKENIQLVKMRKVKRK